MSITPLPPSRKAKAFTVHVHPGLQQNGDVNEHFGLGDVNKSASMSVASKLSQKSADWERSRATGSAAVDLTNLFLNPQKPSSINVWQVARVAMPAAGAPAGWQAAVLSC